MLHTRLADCCVCFTYSVGDTRTMDLTRREMAAVLLKKWYDLHNSSEEEVNDYVVHWLEHLIGNHSLREWPSSMIQAAMEGGPNSRMKTRNIVRFTLFFLGNWNSLLCAGTWILARLACSDTKKKMHKAKQTVVLLLNVHKIAYQIEQNCPDRPNICYAG